MECVKNGPFLSVSPFILELDWRRLVTIDQLPHSRCFNEQVRLVG